jgi:RNA polymerase sigma factor for flagellar operon FliA
MPEDLQSLVERYLDDPSPEHRETVVVAAVPLVRSLIGRINVPDHILASRDDLENSGLIGLMQALDSYDPDRGAKFVTHAYRRVQGALIDYLRSIDVLSRGKRKKIAEAQQAAEKLRQMMGREPQNQDVADYMGISLSEYHRLLTEAQRRFSLSLYNPVGGEGDSHTVLDTLANKDSTRGFNQIEKDSLLDFVENVVNTLPERQQTILGLYYTENLTLREIGDILDLTEARISQILGKILLTLRGRLTEELSAPD